MSKPIVTVRAARGPLIPGTTAIVLVTVEFPQWTDTNEITATVSFTTADWRHEVTHEPFEPPPPRTHRLCGKDNWMSHSELTRELEVEIPSCVPPSHHAYGTTPALRVEVHVDIPFARDVKTSVELPVTHPARVPARCPAYILVSERGTLEVALASTVVVQGEDIAGNLAVSDVPSMARTVRLALVGRTVLDASNSRERGEEAPGRVELEIPLGADQLGAQVPFVLSVPAVMPASSSGPTWRTVYVLEVSAEMADGVVLTREVPVEVLLYSARAELEPMPEAPFVGHERIARLFADAAAERGWSATPTGMERREGACTLRVAYVRDKGLAVEASLSYPPLGLQLSVMPRARAPRERVREIAIGWEEWERLYSVVGRDAHQVSVYVRDAQPAIARLGTVDEWTDHHVTWFRRGGPLERRIASAAADLDLVAREFASALASVVPPPDIQVDVDQWRAFAAHFACTMSVGDLAIHPGAVAPLSIRVLRDREPLALRIGWGDGASASSWLLEVALHVPVVAPAYLASAPAPIAQLLADMKPRILDFAVKGGVVEATLPLDVDPATMRHAIDIGRVREVITMLRTARAVLSPQAGAYR